MDVKASPCRLNRNVKLPSNRIIVEERILQLKRRFASEPLFYKDYVEFMNNIIECGYAERVPDTELERRDGKVWYIQHHVVYHPQKKEMHVVFDCGASFKGASLNANLLQGPDLTRSSIGVLTRIRKEPIVRSSLTSMSLKPSCTAVMLMTSLLQWP